MKNYYCLVAGLREYAIDADTKGFDALAVRDEIAGELSPTDRRTLREFYTFYDVANLIALRSGKSRFEALGNFTREELEEELRRPERLPEHLAAVLAAYNNKAKEDKSADLDESIDTDQPFEKTLWTRFYDACERSGNPFVRHWYAFDRQLRNVSAAYTARKTGRQIEPELVGAGEINTALTRNSAADFGLRAEIDYIDTLVAILEDKNMVEKERRLDLLKWNKADELTDFDYFNLNRILAYCVGIDIIHRWMSLDPRIGNEMFLRLVGELTTRPAGTDTF
jgi:hypothetical protein